MIILTNYICSYGYLTNQDKSVLSKVVRYIRSKIIN
nr:MAG TPA: hypothetical protein [Caudoviricetes sp.]